MKRMCEHLLPTSAHFLVEVIAESIGVRSECSVTLQWNTKLATSVWRPSTISWLSSTLDEDTGKGFWSSSKLAVTNCVQHCEITSDVICMDLLCLCVCLCGELSAHRLQSPPSQGFPLPFVFVCGMMIWSGLSQTAGQTLISSLRTKQTWAADLPWVWTFLTLVFIVFPPGPRECQHFTSCNKVPKKTPDF